MSCPKSYGIEPVKLLYARPKYWRCLRFPIEDGNFPCSLQFSRERNDKEEDRFIKELGTTSDMSTHLKSSSLSLVRFRTSLSKEIGPTLRSKFPERSREINLERRETSNGTWPAKLEEFRLRCVRLENWPNREEIWELLK